MMDEFGEDELFDQDEEGEVEFESGNFEKESNQDEEQFDAKMSDSKSIQEEGGEKEEPEDPNAKGPSQAALASMSL